MSKQRLIPIITILVLLLTAAGPAAASDEGPAPLWPSAQPAVFLPLVVRAGAQYNLTGQVKDAEDLPLAGVTVEIQGGQEALTDANGVFSLKAPEGEQTILASKDGYAFEPGTADLEVSGDLNNLNFSAVSAAVPDVAGYVNMLVNSKFENDAGWVIRDANIESRYVNNFYYTYNTSMLSGVPIGVSNPFKYEWTTSEFYQSTDIEIPANAYYVQARMHLLPRSTDLWGYHINEQAALDALQQQSVPLSAQLANAPDAMESQYGFVCTDGADSDTCNPDNGGKMLFKWYPISSYWWLYRAYDLRSFRGETVSLLFGAANDGYNGNTALYVDDVYLYYCVH